MSWSHATALAGLLVVLLGGCIGGPQAPSDASDDGGPVGPDGGNRTAAPLVWADPVTPWTHWENGTLEGPVTCDTICPDWLVFDITEHVPSGVPVVINATLHWNRTGDIVTTDMTVWISVPDGTIYARQSTPTFNSPVHDQVTVLRQDSDATVTIARNDGGFGTPDYEYSLRIEVRADASTVVPHVPVELPVAAGDVVRLERLDASRPLAGTLYAPGDQDFVFFRTDTDTHMASVPPEWPPGTPVLVLAADASPASLGSVNQTSGHLRPLPLETEFGQVHDASGTEPVEWTFNESAPPLGLAFYLRNNESVLATVNASYGIRSATDVVLSASINCRPCGSGPDGFVLVRSTALGDPRLVAGDYEAWYEPERPSPVEVGHAVIRYVR
jgi:hypothetical protein